MGSGMRRIGVLFLCVLASIATAQQLKLKREVRLKKVLPKAIAFSPDGRYMAVSGEMGDFKLEEKPGEISFEASNTRGIVLLLETSNFKVKREFTKGAETQLRATYDSPVTFSADGRNVLVPYGSSIYVWDAERGQRVATVGSDLSLVRFSGNRRVALAKRKDRRYEMLDLGSGQSLGSFSAETDGKPVLLDRDQPLLVFLKDHNLVLKNLKTNGETTLGPIAGERVGYVTASPDGKLLAVTSDAVSVWSMAESKKLFEGPRSDRGMSGPVFSPDGAWLAYRVGRNICLCNIARASCAVDASHTVSAMEVMFADAQTLLAYHRLESVMSLWSFSMPSGGRENGLPATSGSTSQSFITDRAGNLVASSALAQPASSPAASSASWRWTLGGVQRHHAAIAGMSPGPDLRPGYIYLDIGLSFENSSGRVQEIKFPVPDLFLWHRSQGRRIEPRDFGNEGTRQNVVEHRKKGGFQNLSPDFKFTLVFEVSAGDKRQVSLLFEVPQDVKLDDLELHLPDSTKLSLSGSQ